MDISVELMTRYITVRDWTGRATNQQMATIARSRVPGERLRLTVDGWHRHGVCHERVYSRIGNLGH